MAEKEKEDPYKGTDLEGIGRIHFCRQDLVDRIPCPQHERDFVLSAGRSGRKGSKRKEGGGKWKK